MYFNFWNNGSFPTAWHFYIPTQTSLQPNCVTIPPTQTHIEQNPVNRNEPQQAQLEKKTLISLSEDDLIKAGYETTKKLWSPQQDQMLLKLVEEQKVSWKEIERYMPQRTEKMCYSRYRRLLSQTKQNWSKEEDKKLEGLVQVHGEDWKSFTKQFQNRNSKQLKQRYCNYLRPEISRDQWTLEEDLKIIEFINRFGKKWKLIEKELGNRTDNQIKNRYYGRLKLLYKSKIIKERKKRREAAKKQKE